MMTIKTKEVKNDKKPDATFLLRNSRKINKTRDVHFVLFIMLYDMLFLEIAFVASYFLVSSSVSAWGRFALFNFMYMVAMIIFLNMYGLYRIRLAEHIGWQLKILSIASISYFALYSLIVTLGDTSSIIHRETYLFVTLLWIATIFLPFFGRMILVGISSTFFRSDLHRVRVLVIGTTRLSRSIIQHLAAYPHLGYEVVGVIREQPDVPFQFRQIHDLGVMADLPNVLATQHVDEVFIALSFTEDLLISQCCRICEAYDIACKIIPSRSLMHITLQNIKGFPILSVLSQKRLQWQMRIKRGMDIIIAMLLIIIGLPIWLAIFLLIRLTSPGPGIFRQGRIGRYGKPFTIYKFRTMYRDAEKDRQQIFHLNEYNRALFKVKDDPRCTRIGIFLRRTSLDEIPQLLNIVKGDMSLVGPRPPLPEEITQYEDWELRRLDVLPGLTGLWQIRGRSSLDFNEMVLMDLFYLENWSLGLDLHILLRTIPAVLLGKGAY